MRLALRAAAAGFVTAAVILGGTGFASAATVAPTAGDTPTASSPVVPDPADTPADASLAPAEVAPPTPPPEVLAGAAAVLDAEATATPPIVVEPNFSPPQPSSVGGLRVGAGFAGTPDGTQAVLFGGGNVFDDGASLGDTWTWDGTTWSPRCGTTTPGATAPCLPSPRSLVAAATGPTGVVLYGGQTSDGAGSTVVHDDTYVWDGSAWQLICDACPLGERAGAAAAGNGSIVLLFGGGDTTGGPAPLGDTWQFDGDVWTQVNSGGPGQPVARLGASMAWDGHQFVLFGGFADDGAGGALMASDTWVWTGASWTQVCGLPLAPCGPSGRILGGFANLANPDPTRRGALLVGGLSIDTTGVTAPSVLGDIWFWNGTTWARQASPWPDATSLDGEPPPGLPFVGALASLTGTCRVTLAATFNDETVPAQGTWNLGFDADADGRTDPCPEPADDDGTTAPVAVPVSVPVGTTTPGPTSGTLPATGTQLASLALAGLFLVVIGGLLVVVHHRTVAPPAVRR